MKNRSITAILSIAFLLSIVSNAISETKEFLAVSFNKPGVVLLRYTGASTSSSLYILDKDNNILHSETIKKSGMIKLYNIQALTKGEYFFKLVNKEGTIVKSVVYGNEKATKNLNVALSTSSVPGKVNLTCTGVDAQSVTVNILNQNDEVIFSDNIEVKSNFKRTYDISRVKESNVKFQVESNNRIVTKEVEIKNSTLSLN